MTQQPQNDPYLYNEATLQDVLHYVRYITHELKDWKQAMSDLTDQVDAALALLATSEADAQARYDAAIAAQVAATAVVQASLDALTVTDTALSAADQVNVAELQKALDGLNQANAALAALGQPPIVP